MERMPFKTVLTSANVLLREGLVRILGTAAFDIIASCSFLDDNILNSLPREPAVLLVIDASDNFDVAMAQVEHFKCFLNGRVVVLVNQLQLQLPQMVSAFRRGASAYLTNFMTPEVLIRSFELVMLGQTILPAAMLTYLLNHQSDHSDRRNDIRQDGLDRNEHGSEDGNEKDGPSKEDDDLDAVHPASLGAEGSYLPRLSARQVAILRCLADGDSNKAIARKMRIADATVKVHVKAILRKIHVGNRTQAAIWAIRHRPLTSTNHDSLFCDEAPPIQPAPDVKISEHPRLLPRSHRVAH